MLHWAFVAVTHDWTAFIILIIIISSSSSEDSSYRLSAVSTNLCSSSSSTASLSSATATTWPSQPAIAAVPACLARARHVTSCRRVSGLSITCLTTMSATPTTHQVHPAVDGFYFVRSAASKPSIPLTYPPLSARSTISSQFHYQQVIKNSCNWTR